MRSPAILSLLLLCGLATQANARLFWQTYGSTVPTAEGCAWNANSDYFVPRTCSTGNYGLYSPCKHDCTTSPACRRCHALYPGYCSPYGCAHYCWRNHVYAHKCGCCPVPYCGPYRPGCCSLCLLSHRGCRGGMCGNGMCAHGQCYGGAMYGGEGCVEGEDYGYLPNVESDEFQTLGSISLTGDPLLTSLQLGGTPGGMPLLPGQVMPGQVLPGQLMPGQMMPMQTMPAAVPPVPTDPKLPVLGNQDVEFLPGPQQQQPLPPQQP